MAQGNQFTLIKISKKQWIETGISNGWIPIHKYAQVDFDIPIPTTGGNGSLLSFFNKDKNKNTKPNEEEEKEKEKEDKSGQYVESAIGAATLMAALKALSPNEQNKVLSTILYKGSPITLDTIAKMPENKRNVVLEQILRKNPNLLSDEIGLYSDSELRKLLKNQRSSKIKDFINQKGAPILGRVGAGLAGGATGWLASSYLINKAKESMQADRTVRKKALDNYSHGKSGFNAGSAAMISNIKRISGISSVLDYMGKEIAKELDYISKNL